MAAMSDAVMIGILLAAILVMVVIFFSRGGGHPPKVSSGARAEPPNDAPRPPLASPSLQLQDAPARQAKALPSKKGESIPRLALWDDEGDENDVTTVAAPS